MPRIRDLSTVAAAGASLVANSSSDEAGLIPTSEFLFADDFDTEIGTAVQDALDEKADVNYTQDVTGAVSRPHIRKIYEQVSVFDVMSSSLSDAVDAREVDDTDAADITDAINTVIDDVGTLNKGRILLPAGLYTIANSGSNIGVVWGKSNVFVYGYGALLQLAAGADSHVINIDGGAGTVTGGGLYGVEIDAVRASQTIAVHGIRLESVHDFSITDFYIHDAYHYGIGAQDGSLRNILIARGLIEDTGGDGIDIKNKANDNDNFSIHRVDVRNFGLNGANTVQAGIDCRGKVALSHIRVSGLSADGNGIRFRNGEAGVEANGEGGHHSTLNQFEIDGTGAATGLGVQSAGRDVKIANGYITGGLRGVYIIEQGNRLTNVTVHSVTNDSFYFAESGGFEGDNTIAVSCRSLTSGNRGFRIASDNCQLIGCEATDGTTGISIEATASNTKIIGGYVNNNSTANLSDGGTATRIRDLEGYKTEANILSGTFAVDSTGTKSVAITHGLAITPALQDVQLLMVRDTNVSDFTVQWMRIISVTATVVNAEVRLSSASATVGATAKLACSVRGKLA